MPQGSDWGPGPGWRNLPWGGAIIACAVALVYWNCLQAPLLFDDAGAVVNNASIRHLWSWDVLKPPSDGSTTTGRPIVNLSYALNYAISGLEVWSYHLVNVAIHALAALTLLGIVRRTLPGPLLGTSYATFSLPIAFFVAFLWALHPLNTESVVCIAQRTETLAGLFYLVVIYTFIRAMEKPSKSKVWLTFSVLSCLLGMATKEILATAPILVVLFDRTFVAGSFSAAWKKRRTYYLGLASTWILLGVMLLQNGGARGVSAGFGLGVSSWHYLLKQAEAIVLYLRLSFWPHPLVLDYGAALPGGLSEVAWHSVVVLVLIAGTLWGLVRRPALGFIGAWFFCILAPSSSVVPLVTQSMAEHRMYLPLIAVIGGVTTWLFLRFGEKAIWMLPLVGIVFGAVTIVRTRDYRDPFTIWSNNVAKYPSSARGHNNLALELQRLGKTEEAHREFNEAVSLKPDYVSARYNWGVALLEQQRAKEAIQQFEIAIRYAPGHVDAHINLGNAFVQEGRLAEAIAEFKTVLELQPDAADAHFNLGLALDLVGHSDEAAKELQLALQKRPDLVDAHYRLARIAEKKGALDQAERYYSETLRLSSQHAEAHAALGVLLAQKGDFQAAGEQLEQAVQLRPTDPDALANLGNVLLLQGQAKAAIERYQAALRLRPGDERTKENLRIAHEALQGAQP